LTRPINVEVLDDDSICTLASNQFELAAGEYDLTGWASFVSSGQAKLRLRDVDSGTTLVVGESEYVTTAPTGDSVPIDGRFTVGAGVTLELQYQVAAGRSTDGLGTASGFGESEVYAHLRFTEVVSGGGGGGGSFDPDLHMPWLVEWFGLNPNVRNYVSKTGWAVNFVGSDGAVTLGTANLSGGGMQYGAGAQFDSIEWDVVLAPGTWDLEFMTTKYVDCGIITVTLDGVSMGTIDTYAGGASYNQLVGITGMTVTVEGKQRLKFSVDTKNGSSSGYNVRGNGGIPITLRRTA
jgi:hypothetical protein